MQVTTLNNAAMIAAGVGVMGAGTAGVIYAMHREDQGRPLDISTAKAAAGMGGVLALGIGGTFLALRGNDALMRYAAGTGNAALRGAAAVTGGLAVGATAPFTLLSLPVIGWGGIALAASALEEADY